MIFPTASACPPSLVASPGMRDSGILCVLMTSFNLRIVVNTAEMQKGLTHYCIPTLYGKLMWSRAPTVIPLLLLFCYLLATVILSFLLSATEEVFKWWLLLLLLVCRWSYRTKVYQWNSRVYSKERPEILPPDPRIKTFLLLLLSIKWMSGWYRRRVW